MLMSDHLTPLTLSAVLAFPGEVRSVVPSFNSLSRGEQDHTKQFRYSPQFDPEDIQQYNSKINKYIKEYNAPTFGRELEQATIELLDTLEVPHNPPGFDWWIYTGDRMVRIDPLITKLTEYNHGDDAKEVCEAIGRIGRVMTELQQAYNNRNQPNASVRSRRDFDQLLEKCGVLPGWTKHLHFDSILTGVFGVPPRIARELNAIEYLVPAFRSLSKLLQSYKLPGCLTDVVNMACIVQSDFDDAAPLAAVQTLTRRIEMAKEDGKYDCHIELPAHVLMDCEHDDHLMALALVELARTFNRRIPSMVAHIPQKVWWEQPELCRCIMRTHPSAMLLPDPSSRNGKEVVKFWSKQASK